MTGSFVDKFPAVAPERLSTAQRRTLILCFLVALVDGFDTQVVAFVAPLVMADFGLNSAQMGVAFAAGLAGLIVGSLAISGFADAYGRKPAMVFSCAVIGLFCCLTSIAPNYELFLFSRFLTGFGLGGALPNLIALSSENAPPLRRATLMTIVSLGMPVGAIVGGVVSSMILEIIGWRLLFLGGGIVPLVLTVALILWLPESPRFQELRTEQNTSTSSPLTLFRPSLRATTSIIWLLYFANMLAIFTLISWMPAIMQQAGLKSSHAILTVVLFNVGSIVGGFLLARMIDRIGPFPILPIAAAAAIPAIAGLGGFAGEAAPVFVLVLITGACTAGLQFGINIVTLEAYPTSVRATGLGAALAVGRFGAVVGPWAVGGLLDREWHLQSIFIVLGIPSLFCAIILTSLIRKQSIKTGSFQST